jgi:pimeloyl-ACP methyl ester carboxylesterase
MSDYSIPVSASVSLPGILEIPDGAVGLVIFAHGSGSSRLSPRNRAVASRLRESGRLGTLLFDLLTPTEAADRANVFDIDLIASRLLGATEWVRRSDRTRHLAAGFFGASTGAAAAVLAAGARPALVDAIVSRGGRPDLAAGTADQVQAPTLLIVGSEDTAVLELNRSFAAGLTCENELAIVPGAGHLFEEPGALEEVARLAGEWLTRHLCDE